MEIVALGLLSGTDQRVNLKNRCALYVTCLSVSVSKSNLWAGGRRDMFPYGSLPQAPFTSMGGWKAKETSGTNLKGSDWADRWIFNNTLWSPALLLLAYLDGRSGREVSWPELS